MVSFIVINVRKWPNVTRCDITCTLELILCVVISYEALCEEFLYSDA